MIPRSFEYSAPGTLNEAVSLLHKLGPDAKILSGGQSLIPMMKLRLASPPHIVDINRIPGLDYITETSGRLANRRARAGERSRAFRFNSITLPNTHRHYFGDSGPVGAKPGHGVR